MTGLNMINNVGDQGGQWPTLAVECRNVRRYDGDTIKEARLRAGLTQPQLAAAVGAKPRTVGNWQQHGIADDNVFFAKVEQVLRLTPEAAADPNDPRNLDNGALMALGTAVWAEIQRRFWELTKGQAGLPNPWPGTTLPYPSHLDEGPATPDRAEASD